MTTDIPTVPQDDPAKTIMAALAHGITGHPEKAAVLFEPFLAGPATAVGLCAALAETVVRTDRQAAPKDSAFGLLVYDADTGQHGDINALPAGIRFAAQFTAAWANNDTDTAHALFDALAYADTEEAADALAVGIRALYDMAVTTLSEQTGHGKNGAGR